MENRKHCLSEHIRDAHIKHDEARDLLAQKIDPGEKLKSDKLSQLIKAAITFTHVADEFADKLDCEDKAPVTLLKKKWLLAIAKADFVHKPINEIKAPEILHTLKKVEDKGNYETNRPFTINDQPSLPLWYCHDPN